MKIKWLLQDVGRSVMLHDNFSTVRQMGSEPQSFGLMEGLSELTNLEHILTDVEDVYIVRGGTKVVYLLNNFDDLEILCPYLNPYQKAHKEIFLSRLRQGMFYDAQAFDQHHYNTLGLPLLNAQAFFLPIAHNRHRVFEEDLFIKPSMDLKTFLPGILKAGQSIESFILASQHMKNYDHERALLAPVQPIHSEYRFFVVNGEVVTGSLYKMGSEIKTSEVIPGEVEQCAQEYAQLYQPHAIFTMDLAVTAKGIKIVEYNCWNGSGLYACDKLKLFQAVQSHVSLTHQNRKKTAP